jgi:transcription elongation GreA/GreB family factor
MDKNLKKEKLEMWRKQHKQLEAELAETMLARGKAAQEGDLSENAAYKDYTEKSEMISAQIASVQRMIKEIEGTK